MEEPISIAPADRRIPGSLTLTEILQQPILWPTSIERIENARSALPVSSTYAIVTGAGTSAYAAAAVAQASDLMREIPTTDLLTASRDEIVKVAPEFAQDGLLVSLARSGNSPESVAVVERFQTMFPNARHLAITCNREGRLANMPDVQAIVLDPRTNDRSLAMTSSFSNLVLAGLALQHSEELAGVLPGICRRATQLLPQLQRAAEKLAQRAASRVLILASGVLRPFASEAALKVLEMTAGRVVTFSESYLGLRHGPMSLLQSDSLVLCLASSDPLTRRYEEDLVNELRQKKLGHIIAIAPEEFAAASVEQHIEPIAPELPDSLRTPFEIVFPQLFAYQLSLRSGLNPDEPSPDGVITRVVERFRIHKDGQ